jgi:integrase
MRTVRNRKLDNRTARERLTQKEMPAWHSLSGGELHIGYNRNRGSAEGYWLLRRVLTPRPATGSIYRKEKLGTADDVRNADGQGILDWPQAQRRAWDRLDEINRRERDGETDTSPLTVRKAVANYVEHLRINGKNADEVESRAAAFILPKLGDELVSDVTTTRLKTWLRSFVEHGARVRTGKGERQKYKDKPETKDGLRARRATANRNWTTLRAALNYAFEDDKVDDDRAWRKVKPFEKVDAARPGYLQVDEAKRVVNAADAESGFRNMVQAGLETGCRYGELCALNVRDFSKPTGKLAIVMSKSGKRRDVTLSKSAIEFFDRLCVGRDPDDVMLPNNNWEARKERTVANEFWRQVRLEYTKRREQAKDAGKSWRGIGLNKVAADMEATGLRAKIAAKTVDDRRWHNSEQVRPMSDACKGARIKAIGFHQLRHTWASLAVMGGMPLIVVAKNLGHKDTRMVEAHYSHLAADYVDTLVREHAPRYGFDAAPTNVQPLRRR